MRLQSIYIRNYKSIRDLRIQDMEHALILVGKNNTGKTGILDAILTATGSRPVTLRQFREPSKPIVIGGTLHVNGTDIQRFWQNGVISHYKKWELWKQDVASKLPGLLEGQVTFEFVATPDGKTRLGDGIHKKQNPYIAKIFPKIYYIDYKRDIWEFQKDILEQAAGKTLGQLHSDACMFDQAKTCNRCFQCVGLIHKKRPEEMTVFETARLLEYKLYHTELTEFEKAVNRNFHKNCGQGQDITYGIEFDAEEVFRVNTMVYNRELEEAGPLEHLSEGFKSIYLLSLLETYIGERGDGLPSIIMMEDPEMFLHPQLQKTASEILYGLSKKNQVIFSTHSPNMIFNFSSKQIKLVTRDEGYATVVSEDEPIDRVLDDLGYAANDLMNVSFVFIVEGKQDRARLPLLLEQYYSEIMGEDGKLKRISIIPVNSCTNIKTYANLKYINQLYLKDQFLMIRDGDGKDPEVLASKLCGYYADREKQDQGNLPRVTRRNVLILKYYSFENYFLDPQVMVKIGVLSSEEEFYDILYSKWVEYLHKLTSAKRMKEQTGLCIQSKDDLKANMELFKIYMRGHNLFDIFYGRYRGEREEALLRQYIEYAPRKTFADILDAIDQFVYFENRRKDNTSL